jgi:hypothetical protein
VGITIVAHARRKTKNECVIFMPGVEMMWRRLPAANFCCCSDLP